MYAHWVAPSCVNVATLPFLLLEDSTLYSVCVGGNAHLLEDTLSSHVICNYFTTINQLQLLALPVGI